MSRYSYHLTEIGIKQIYICPDVNYGAAVHADKWIPVLPNTDAALQLAIVYQWIVNDTYDKEYLKTHAIGFEKFKAYVLGEEDGIAKTPEWAAEQVPEFHRAIIKALARRFARTATSITHCLGGPYIRGAYSTEPARLEVVLLAMQGLGKPGVNQASFISGALFVRRRHRAHLPFADAAGQEGSIRGSRSTRDTTCSCPYRSRSFPKPWCTMHLTAFRDLWQLASDAQHDRSVQ